MSKIFLTVLAIYTDFQAACLSITQVGAASYLKIFLLSWGPCLYVNRFHFEICKVTGAAFQCTNRNIKGTEQVYGILP